MRKKSLSHRLRFNTLSSHFSTRSGLTLQLPNSPPVRSTLRGIVTVLFVLTLNALAQSPSPSPASVERTIIISDPIPPSESCGSVRTTDIAADLMIKEGANTPNRSINVRSIHLWELLGRGIIPLTQPS